MVGIVKRMTRLKQLVRLKFGPGAMILPPEVSGLHMDFVATYNDGHKGARVFWRNDLKSLKYWNPAVPMTVSRTENPDNPATMTVTFKPSTTSSTTSTEPSAFSTQTSAGQTAPSTEERIEIFNIKDRNRSEIFSELRELTNGKLVEPGEKEKEEKKELRIKGWLAQNDAKSQLELEQKRRAEKRRIELARAKIDAPLQATV